MSAAAAGAYAARAGPPWLRRVQDTGRAPALAALLLLLVVVLVVVAGLGVLCLRSDLGPVGTLFAGCFFLVAAGVAVVTAETVTRWWWRGRPAGTAVLVAAPSGAPSTALLRSRAALVTPWTAGLTTTGWCVVMAAATPSPPWLRGLFAVLAVAAATRLVGLVSGRAQAGGVYLTPEAVELRWGVVTTVVPWAGSGSRSDVALLDRGVARTPGTTQRRSFPVQVPVPTVDRAPAGTVEVPWSYLPGGSSVVRELVERAVRSPRQRGQLGTPGSLPSP